MDKKVGQKKWREENKGRIREYRKKYKRFHSEKIREAKRRWWFKNKERLNSKRRLIENTRNHKVRGVKLRFQIFLRDNFTCQYCGRTPKEDGIKLELDHILPKSFFPSKKYDKTNLLTSCQDCNKGKTNLLLTV